MPDIISRWIRHGVLGTVALFTIVLWVAALLLWCAHDLASGAPLPRPLQMLMVETFLIGSSFSAILATVIALAQSLKRRPKVLMVGAAALLLAALHGWIDSFQVLQLRLATGGRPVPVFELFTAGLMPFVLIYGLYATAISLMLSAVAVRETERRLAEARDAAQQAQLAALRFQLNPHFLFNTLNAISSLIVTHRNDEAEEMTVKLSDFLRTSLEADPESEVSLDEELATTQSYLEIETVRFGQRLQVEYDCPATLLGAHVPSFLLQPIVENSIKYAVAPSRRPVTISIRAVADVHSLRLSVEDDGRQAFGTAPAGGTGLGLANVRKRLAAFYGNAASLEALVTDRGFAVSLAMPLRQKQDLLAAE